MEHERHAATTAEGRSERTENIFSQAFHIPSIMFSDRFYHHLNSEFALPRQMHRPRQRTSSAERQTEREREIQSRSRGTRTLPLSLCENRLVTHFVTPTRDTILPSRSIDRSDVFRHRDPRTDQLEFLSYEKHKMSWGPGVLGSLLHFAENQQGIIVLSG